MDYSKHVSTRKTHQRERTPGRTDEIKNSEGGYVHQVDEWDRLDRFLILGSEGGSYYVNESKLTKDNAQHVIGLIKSDGKRVVDRVVEISDEGRAHKNDPALFVLAMAANLGNEETRKAAYNAVPKVARIGTHLFQFVQFAEAFGGWGRGMKRAVSRWYNGKDAERLAFQLLKYRQRAGWSHRDVLRLAHPVTDNQAHRQMFDVTVRPEKLEEALSGEHSLPRIYEGFYLAQAKPKPDASLIAEYGLTREMLPTDWLKDEAVNKELLKSMPLMATIRNLGRLSANGVLKPLSDETDMVIERIMDDEQIKRSRIHPMHYLLAIKTYDAGMGWRGGLDWKVNPRISDALNEGFYKAFRNVEPTGKAFLLGVDVSGSMSATIGDSFIRCSEAAAAMAMTIARTEDRHFIHGFTAGSGSRWNRRQSDTSGFVNLGIGPKTSLSDAMQKTRNANFGGTDCALPMLYALWEGIKVDTFVVLTDSETWAGEIKPAQALAQYREKINPDAKLIVVGMVSNNFTIADPNDSGMLDVVGFDAGVPQIITEFSR